MTRLGRVLLLVLPIVACGPPGARPTHKQVAPGPDDDRKPDAAQVMVDARVPPRDTRAPSPSPDTAEPEPTPPTPDAGFDPEPIVDADPPPPDLAEEEVPAPVVPDASTSPDSGGAGPATEAMWSHTNCNQGALMFPNIDKNMGRFPPGSCPPPEMLNRTCGGNSRIAVRTATASAYETGYVHPPGYAVDQYIMTRWSSPTGATAWLAMDLGSEQTFKRIYLAWELAHASDYDIVTSNDGSNWTMLKQVRGGNGYQDIVDVEGRARHIRINGVTRGRTGGQLYGYSLFDVTICGERP